MFLHPYINSRGIYNASDLDPNAPVEKTIEEYPLYRYATLMKTTLRAGDAIFNPPWWWHSVKNKSDTSIGVATRWEAPLFGTNPNPFFSVLQVLTWFHMKLLWHLKAGGRLSNELNKLNFDH